MLMHREAGAHTGPLLVLGYGLYAAANSVGYLNAMGTVEANLGFVSQLPFMAASCIAQVVVAFVIALLARRRSLSEGRVLPCAPGYALLLVGGVVSVAAGLLPGSFADVALPGAPGVLAVVLGVLRGAGSLVAGVAWCELIIVNARSSVPTVLLCVSVLHAGLGLVLGMLPAGVARQAVMMLVYVLSWLVASRLYPCSAASVHEFCGQVELSRGPGRGFAGAWLCLLVCQFVVGIANTAVFESPFAPTLGSVNVDVCILAATAVLALLFVGARHLPEPAATFKVVMPVLLAVFTATALASGSHGAAMGYAMITCYEAIAITYSVYLVQFMQEGRYRLHAFVALATGAASLTLLLGLGIGVGLNVLSNNHGVPLFTLLAFVAIYPLGLALLFVQRNRVETGAPAPGAPAREGGAPAGPELEADLFAQHVAVFAQAHDLTPRETQLCALLVRGHTVKAIGESLGVTENTAWTHIRSIYAKCGVNTKQALIELFERAG